MTATQRLPRAVRMQDKKANDLVKQVHEAPPPPTTVEEQAPDTGTPPPPATPPPEPTPTPPPAPSTPPAPSVTLEQLQAQIASQEHRISTLTGMTRTQQAEITRLKQEKEALELRRETSKSPAERARAELKPEEISTMGDDELDRQARVASGVMKPEVAALRQEISEMRAKAFRNELTALLPNWREINVRQDWLEWLGTAEPSSGQEWQTLLDNAYHSVDATRAAYIFNRFITERGITPAAAAPPPSAALPSRATPRPSSAPPPPPPPPSKGEVVTRAEVTKFYQEVAQRMYKSRPDERAKIEARINKAVAEGRIQ